MHPQIPASTDRAQSEVLATVLMVGLTVILAATTAVLVLGIGDDVSSTAPTVGWEYDYNDGDVQATLVSGEDINRNAVTVRGTCAADVAGSGTITSSTTLTIGDNCAASGESLSIVWQNTTNDRSALVGEFTN